tara:strand:- start:2089 stop:3105 length:1017 start_codon:yes stop_codon:yes gene_type:complete
MNNEWININQSDYNLLDYDCDFDNKLILKLNNEQEYQQPYIIDDIHISDHIKLEKIYKLKYGLIKLNNYHKNILNSLTDKQKELYLSNYQVVIGDYSEPSKLSKIAYAIFYEIKNINNIKNRDIKIYGQNYWEIYFKKILKRFINFTKYSILYDQLYFNNIKNRSIFNLTGINTNKLKKNIDNWKFNCNKFNMVKKYIKNKYYSSSKKYNFNDINLNIQEISKNKVSYNETLCYMNNYLNENNIDIVKNILNKTILSYKFFNDKFVIDDDDCIKKIYSSSAQVEGWYNFYFNILNKHFDIWKYKLKKNNKFVDNIKFDNKENRIIINCHKDKIKIKEI